MYNVEKHIISEEEKALTSLGLLEQIKKEAVLFVIDKNNKFIGSLTDGDIRRGLFKGLSINEEVRNFIEHVPFFIEQENIDINKIKDLRESGYKLIPIINRDREVVGTLNFANQKTLLPVTVLIMAGGEGKRLRPLTQNVPKPLLKVGNKTILEHNLIRLAYFGINEVFISVNYLADMIKDQIGNGSAYGLTVNYVHEKDQLGTIGALSLISKVKNKTILVQNSDLLTDVDLEGFYQHLQNSSSDLSVLGIPYDINVPYAVLNESNGYVTGFTEKPTYSYYCNGGFYLFKSELKDLVPYNAVYNATDLMAQTIAKNKKVSVYPHLGYWLDIGKHEDFAMAQRDIQLLDNRWI